MADYVSFAFSEIERVGVICPDCKSEIIIDLTEKAAPNVPYRCPACFGRENKPPFVYGANASTWSERIGHMRKIEESHSVRLYFKDKKS